MTPLAALFATPIVHRLGWMLLHSFWQLALVSMVLAVVLVLLKRRSANVRYVAGCVALLLMAALPMVTLPLLVPPVGPVGASSAGPASPGALPRLHLLPSLPAASARPMDSSPAAHPEPVTPPWHVRIMAVLEQNLSRIVIAWAAGVLVLSLRILAGWLGAQRLRRRRCRPAEECWQHHLAELARRIGVVRPVQLLQSHLARVPTVVGHLRPVVLLPVAALTGLAPQQVESILAHELAHIRRHDYLVNLVQVLVETVLFYHPAVWWVSRRIRIERENCCDDIAIALCGDRFGYIRALVSLEELRNAPLPQLVVAWQGTSLLERARRLLGVPSPQTLQSGRWIAGPAVLLAGLMAISLLLTSALWAQAPEASARTETAAHSRDPWQHYVVKDKRKNGDGEEVLHLSYVLPKEFEGDKKDKAKQEISLQVWFASAPGKTDLSSLAEIVGKHVGSRPATGPAVPLAEGQSVLLSDEQVEKFLAAAKGWGKHGVETVPAPMTGPGAGRMVGARGVVQMVLPDAAGQDKRRLVIGQDVVIATRMEFAGQDKVKLDLLLRMLQRDGGKGGERPVLALADVRAAEIIPAGKALLVRLEKSQVQPETYRSRVAPGSKQEPVDVFFERVGPGDDEVFLAVVRPMVNKPGHAVTRALGTSGDLLAKIGQLDINEGTLADVVRIFGEPETYMWGPSKTFTKDNLPDSYVMNYGNGFNVFMDNGQIQEIRFEGPSDYVFRGQIRFGSSLEEVLAALGPPTRVAEGEELHFEDGVLYKNFISPRGMMQGQGASYYGRQDQGVRLWLMDERVASIYVTRTRPRSGTPGPLPDMEARVAQFRINDAKREDVIQTFGQPVRYMGEGYKRVKEDELPDSYQMEYPGGFSVYVFGGQVQELRFDGRSPQNAAAFAYKGLLRVGSSLEEALQVMGPPDRVVEGQKLDFEEGVLYKDIDGHRGEGYYQRTKQGVRIWTAGNRVKALYLPRTGPSTEETTFRSQVGDRLANLDLNTWTYNDVVAALGEPTTIRPDRQKVTRDKQSGQYTLAYFHAVTVDMDGDRIKGIGIGTSSYLYRGKITAGTPEQTVFEVLGQPREVRTGQPDDGTDGVLYKEYLPNQDAAGVSLYRRADQGIVLYLHDGKVMSMKLVPTQR